MRITFKNLTSIYHHNTPFEHLALNDINTTFEEGVYYGIIGHTGSGKSTMIQTLNGLLLPNRGEVQVGDILLKRKSKQKDIHQVKKHVGMVFQFPEHQLFEETVLKDVMFGPKNMGMDEAVAQEKAEYYLDLLNIDASLFQSSPFDLSGGQMRKVAIAGILAMGARSAHSGRTYGRSGPEKSYRNDGAFQAHPRGDGHHRHPRHT